MSMLRQSKIFYTVIILIILLFMLIFVYVIKPLDAEKNSLSEQLTRKKMEMNVLQKKAMSKEQDESKNLVQLDQIRKQMPEQPYIESLLRDLHLMEVSSGIQMQFYNVQIGDKPVFSEMISTGNTLPAVPAQSIVDLSQYVYPIQVTTSFNGGYLEIHRLLEEAETMNRLWQVQNITFAQEEKLGQVSINKKNSALSVQVTFVAYYAPGLISFYRQPMPIEHVPASNTGIPF